MFQAAHPRLPASLSLCRAKKGIFALLECALRSSRGSQETGAKLVARLFVVPQAADAAAIDGSTIPEVSELKEKDL